MEGSVYRTFKAMFTLKVNIALNLVLPWYIFTLIRFYANLLSYFSPL